MIQVFMAAAFAVTLQQTDTTFAVRARGHLDIDTHHAGRITIRGWDRQEMRVRARHPQGVRIDIDREDDHVRLEPEARRSTPGPVEFDIQVPRQFDIAISAVNSSIDVADVEGDIDLENVNGDILVAGVSGRIDVSSIEGRITVRDTRGDLSADAVNREVEVSGHQGEINLETVNGGIVLRSIRSGSVNAESINGSVEYDGEIRTDGSYELTTHNGAIVVYVPEGVGANVVVETFQGEIESDFPVSLRDTRRHERSVFTIGNGGGRLRLTSFGGNIRLRRPVRR